MDSKGFSLLQVIFASSVVGALTLAGVKMMRDQQQMAKLTSQRFEEKYVLSNMRRILTDPASCRATFSGFNSTTPDQNIEYLVQSFTPVNSTQEARLFLYQTFSSSEKMYGNENVRIHKLELTRGPEAKFGNLGYLNVTFDRGPLFHSNRMHRERIPLHLKWNAEGKLKSCRVWVDQNQDDPYWKIVESSKSVSLMPKTDGQLVVKKSKSQAPSSLAPASTMTGILRAQTQKLQSVDCKSEHKGALIYSREEKKLFVCSQDNQWQALSENTPELRDSQEFILGAQQIETQVTQALICSLERAENMPISAQCEVKSPQKLPVNRLNIDPGTWNLRLSGQAKPNSKCVYRCYF